MAPGWAPSSSLRPGSGPAARQETQYGLRLQTTTPWASLAQIRFQAPLPAPAVDPAAQSKDEEPLRPAYYDASVHLEGVVAAIEAAVPDFARSAVIHVDQLDAGNGMADLQLVCAKPAVAKAYKALLPLKARLGLRLGDVKSSVSLAPLPCDQVSATLQRAMTRELCHPPPAPPAAGDGAATDRWHQPWGGSGLFDRDPLAAPPGEVTVARRLRLEVVAAPPNSLTLLVQGAGAVKLRAFSLAQWLLGEGGPARLPEPLGGRGASSLTDGQLLADAAQLRAATRVLTTAGGAACKLLPDLRDAVVMGLAAPPPPVAAAAMRAAWQAAHGLRLPDPPPACCYEVSGDGDPNGPTTLVPACCVLSPLGLTPLPATAREHMSGPAALRLVAARLLAAGGPQGGGALWGKLTPLDAGAAAARGAGGAAAGGGASSQAAAAAGGGGWQTASSLAAAGAASTAALPHTVGAAAVGPHVQFISLDAEAGGAAGEEGGTGPAIGARGAEAARPRFDALSAFLDRQEAEEQAAAQKQGPLARQLPPTLAAAAAAAASRAPAGGKRPPASAARPTATAGAAGGTQGQGAAAEPSAAVGLTPALQRRSIALPALGKRPGLGGPVGAKPPPAAKKSKAAGSAGAGRGTKAAGAASAEQAGGATGGAVLPAEAAAAGGGAGMLPAAAAAGPTKPPAPKRPKKEVDAAAAVAKVTAAALAGAGFKGVTGAELQAFLRARCLPVGGKKAELEARAAAAACAGAGGGGGGGGSAGGAVGGC